MVNRTIKILLMFLFALNLSDGLFSPLFAVFVQDFIVGASLSTVGIAVALLSISKSVVQVPLARWLDKHGSDKGEYYAMLAGAGLLKGFAITTIIGLTVGILITRPAYSIFTIRKIRFI